MVKGTYLSNPRRQQLIEMMKIAIAAHQQREHVGDSRHLDQAYEFNYEFVNRSRGHGGKRKPHSSTYVRSVALARR